MKQYILFDLDGTLWDSSEGITKGVAYALADFGIQVEDLKALCSFIGPPLPESFQKHYHFTPEQCERAVKKYREYYAEGKYQSRLYDGIEKLLPKLEEKGAYIAAATTKPQKAAEELLRYFGLDKYFRYICGSVPEENRYKKRDVLRWLLEELALDKEQVVMVGDREDDIAGARENGIDCIGVLYGFGSREELTAAGAVKLAEDVEELEKLLFR